MIALERAFGNQIKHSLGEKPGLSPKSGRLLAGQLASKPRDFGTDGRLIAALAADAIEAPRSDIGTLRLGVLQRFITNAEANTSAPPKARPSRSQKARASEAAPQPQPSATPAQVAQPAAITDRPDPAQFTRAVLAAARTKAEGWPGNRKAYVSHVWRIVREEQSQWALTEIEFKCMLTEAHRTGLLTLVTADLKNARTLKDLQESAISYKNTIWHFIRVED
ncbi:MAG: hypothetical protein HC868_09325 [Sphingomonadales bacterium]|nr:hypothetical protein [Sphingomonadales bacterium]